MKINKKELLLFLLHFLLILAWFTVKASITVIFVFLVANDWVTVGGVIRKFPIADSVQLAYMAEYLYLILIIIIPIYMAIWSLAGLNRKNYIIFVIFLIIFAFLSFSPQMHLARQRGNCPSDGGVWDYDLQKCRKSCLRQPYEDDCIPIENNSK